MTWVAIQIGIILLAGRLVWCAVLPNTDCSCTKRGTRGKTRVGSDHRPHWRCGGTGEHPKVGAGAPIWLVGVLGLVAIVIVWSAILRT